MTRLSTRCFPNTKLLVLKCWMLQIRSQKLRLGPRSRHWWCCSQDYRKPLIFHLVFQVTALAAEEIEIELLEAANRAASSFQRIVDHAHGSYSTDLDAAAWQMQTRGLWLQSTVKFLVMHQPEALAICIWGGNCPQQVFFGCWCSSSSESAGTADSCQLSICGLYHWHYICTANQYV